LKDKLIRRWVEVMLDEPQGLELPPRGFAVGDAGYVAPSDDSEQVQVSIDPASNRLQKLEAFRPWEGTDILDLGY
jgi:aconitate hydratase